MPGPGDVRRGDGFSFVSFLFVYSVPSEHEKSHLIQIRWLRFNSFCGPLGLLCGKWFSANLPERELWRTTGIWRLPESMLS